NQTDDGIAYRKIVDTLVGVCAANRVYLDLDLHWSDCGKWVNEGGKLGQHNLPDAHSIAFWQDVATRYRNHPNVIFGLYNEPHDVPWAVWLKGGTVTDKPSRRERDQTQITYEAVGMQQLYHAVRKAGAQNLVTASGLEWGYDLSGVSKGYALVGTNIIYETHPYPNKKNWDKCFGGVSEKYPVYVGEWGFRGTNGLDYAKRLMSYIQQRHIQAWTAWDFHPHAGPSLIKNWDYEPTLFGQFVKDLLTAKQTPDSMSP
ncbi:MAG TPA: cellulase family glycosylhydrolase, partial [Verrucomicrobiae bacterium]|nr:cellulase family glycosylhydrolase [Verrucomicrobiae bacterium]